MAVADVENTEAAQTIDVLATLNVSIAVRARVAPLDDGPCAVYLGGFPIFEKPRIDVIAEVFNGFPRDPRGLFRRNRRRFD